jgi:hypothetical protein
MKIKAQVPCCYYLKQTQRERLIQDIRSAEFDHPTRSEVNLFTGDIPHRLRPSD